MLLQPQPFGRVLFFLQQTWVCEKEERNWHDPAIENDEAFLNRIKRDVPSENAFSFPPPLTFHYEVVTCEWTDHQRSIGQ